jgi:TPR repeat protein
MKAFLWAFAMVLFLSAPAVSMAAGTFVKDDITTLQHKADEGDPVAQFNLGSRYFNGEDVKKNEEQAGYWWKRAAKQGHANAQSHLGELYDKGHGMEQDYRRAYFWYSLAVKGTDWNVAYHTGPRKDAAAKHLTPDQISDADKAVAEWKPTKEEPQPR